MAKKAEDRYRSMAELAAALTDHLRAGAAGANRPSGPGADETLAPLVLSAAAVVEEDTEAVEEIRVSRTGGRRAAGQLRTDSPARKTEDESRRRAKSRRKKTGRRVPPWVWLAGAGLAVLLVLLGRAIFRTSNSKADADQPAKDKPGGQQQQQQQQQQAQAFRPLFNGKDLSGWKTFPGAQPQQPGNWRVEKGILIGAGPAPVYLFSERGDYKDFHLRVEARINDRGNSGVFLRSDLTPDTPKGYEAQINSTHRDPVRTGSLHPFNLGMSRAERQHVSVTEQLHRPGEWFTLEAIVEGNHIVLKVNGKTTVDFTDEKKLFPLGHFALQQLDAQTVVEFSKIEVMELPAGNSTTKKTPGFVSLFNGNDLAGWEVESGARNRWWVGARELVAAGADKPEDMGWLLTQRDYSDFILRFEFMLSRGGNSGVTFRAALGEKKHLEIQILDDSRYPEIQDTALTGSLYGLALDRRANLKSEGEWNQMEIELRGRSLRVTVNGRDTLQTNLSRFGGQANQLPALKRVTGRIGLQNWDRAVRFRNIQLQDLSD
jgi:hypothetical protein